MMWYSVVWKNIHYGMEENAFFTPTCTCTQLQYCSSLISLVIKGWEDEVTPLCGLLQDWAPQ